MVASVTVIIPHFVGDVLLNCLRALYSNTSSEHVEVIIVDDSVQSDGSVNRAVAMFPGVQVIKTQGGVGFGAACNLALRHISSPYVVLLNDDVEVTAGWLQPMLDVLEKNPDVAICQPKVLSLRDRVTFDPGGGAGGCLDILGYPFAFGSMIHTSEQDHGQYDDPRDLCWAQASAMVLRTAVLPAVGYFDESFYMQAEEIDLCCRVLRQGYRIRSVPSSLVYHYFGWTLHRGSIEKFYLSHRNTMICMLKNWPMSWLVWAFPLRVGLELLTIVYGIFVRWDFRQPAAVIMALGSILLNSVKIQKQRRVLLRSQPNNLTGLSTYVFKGSLIWTYFVRRITTCTDLFSGQKA